MKDLTNLRRDLQAVVKAYRDALPKELRYSGDGPYYKKPDYPVCSMTEAQNRKREATVNFGDGQDKQDHLAAFTASHKFQDFTYAWGVKCAGAFLDLHGCLVLKLVY